MVEKQRALKIRGENSTTDSWSCLYIVEDPQTFNVASKEGNLQNVEDISILPEFIKQF